MLNSAQNALLKQKPLVLVGFGAQGRAEALNLKRCGIEFRLALRPSGPSFNRAKTEGFNVVDLENFDPTNAMIALNLPDQTHPQIASEIRKRGQPTAWIFAHGFSTHFKTLEIHPGGPAHILVAPKGAAHGLVEFFETQKALPAILAIENSTDSFFRSWAEAFALGVGCHPKGLIWASFKDETECDLFSEQALLCGGVSALLRTTYEVMIEAGYHPQAAYFESLYELKLIVDLIWSNGISGMRDKISPTARYGDITRGPRIIGPEVKERMKEVLTEIQTGAFAREFLEKIQSSSFAEKEERDRQHPLEKIGREIRSELFKS